MPMKDRAARLAYLKAYRARPEEQARRQRERHLWDSAKHANERAAKYGCEGVLRMADVVAVYKRCGHVCSYCGSDKLLGLDHVKPLHDGGANTVENCVLACRSCNASKWRGESPWQWSRDWNACRDCGTTERKHSAQGLCNRCYLQRKPRGHIQRVLEGVA